MPITDMAILDCLFHRSRMENEMIPISDHPAVVEARERRASLQERRQRLQQDLERAREDDAVTVEERADLAFHGQATRTVAPDVPAPAKIRKELEAVEMAIRRSQTELRNARRRAEDDLVETLRPRYAKVQRRASRVVRELLEVAAEERALRDELAEAGGHPLARGRDFNPLPEDRLRAWLVRAEKLS